MQIFANKPCVLEGAKQRNTLHIKTLSAAVTLGSKIINVIKWL